MSGYEIVEVTQSCSSQCSASATAFCPAGKKVVGGGGRILNGTSISKWVSSSYPYSNGGTDSGWQITVVSGSNSPGIVGLFTVYAICVVVA
jgi:hypothetical protein